MGRQTDDQGEPASGIAALGTSAPLGPAAGSSVAAPSTIEGEFAALFRLSKKRLLDAAGTGDSVAQTGGAYLAEPFAVPAMGRFAADLIEPVIETFVVEADGGCTATGSDTELIEAWLPTVCSMVAAIYRAVAEFEIELEGPSYLTASLTPTNLVTTVPHLDDDQFVAEEGVGLVAIAASHAGPRLALGALGHPPARSPLPLELHQDEFDRFEAESLPLQRTAADRIVIFPQFGQMHAGPVIDQPTTDPIRHLLVFRAATRPSRSD